MLDSQQARIGKKRSFLMFVGLVACGILLNILGTRINGWLNLPFYLDNIGTILTALVGGYLPCIAVGFFYNIIVGIGDNMTTYYCFILHQRAYRVGGGVLCADGLADEVPEDARRHTDLFRYRRNRRRCAYVVPLRSQLGRGCRGYARAEHHQLYGHEPLFGGLGGELPDRYCRQGDIHLCRASALEAPAEKIHRLLRDF